MINNYYPPKVGLSPFGMLQPGRYTNSGLYRYAFQGREKDKELYGEGNSYSFKYRIHDARLGRFLSVDPLTAKYPFNSPYAFSENRVVDGVELEGLEYTDLNGKSWHANNLKEWEQKTIKEYSKLIISNILYQHNTSGLPLPENYTNTGSITKKKLYSPLQLSSANNAAADPISVTVTTDRFFQSSSVSGFIVGGGAIAIDAIPAIASDAWTTITNPYNLASFTGDFTSQAINQLNVSGDFSFSKLNVTTLGLNLFGAPSYVTGFGGETCNLNIVGDFKFDNSSQAFGRALISSFGNFANNKAAWATSDFHGMSNASTFTTKLGVTSAFSTLFNSLSTYLNNPDKKEDE